MIQVAQNQPMMQVAQNQPMTGGFLSGIGGEISVKNEMVEGPTSLFGGGPMLAVDTSRDAFERDGLLEMGGMGLGRMPRRNPFRSMGGGMMGGSSLLDNSMNNGMSTGSSNAPIKVTKME